MSILIYDSQAASGNAPAVSLLQSENIKYYVVDLLTDLFQYMLRHKGSIRLLVLSIREERELNALLQSYPIVDSIDKLIVLFHATDRMIQKGYLLRPRFMICHPADLVYLPLFIRKLFPTCE